MNLNGIKCRRSILSFFLIKLIILRETIVCLNVLNIDFVTSAIHKFLELTKVSNATEMELPTTILKK